MGVDVEESPHRTRVFKTRVSLLLPHDLLSSSCKLDSDRPIAHSDLFFLCSSSSDCSSVLRRQIVPLFVVRSSNRPLRSILRRQIVPQFFVARSFLSLSSDRWFFVVKSVRTYVIHLLGTYVTIICNWLIFWQNALYL